MKLLIFWKIENILVLMQEGRFLLFGAVTLTLWTDVLLPCKLLPKTVPSQASRAGEMRIYLSIYPVYKLRTIGENSHAK